MQGVRNIVIVSLLALPALLASCASGPTNGNDAEVSAILDEIVKTEILMLDPWPKECWRPEWDTLVARRDSAAPMIEARYSNSLSKPVRSAFVQILDRMDKLYDSRVLANAMNDTSICIRGWAADCLLRHHDPRCLPIYVSMLEVETGYTSSAMHILRALASIDNSKMLLKACWPKVESWDPNEFQREFMKCLPGIVSAYRTWLDEHSGRMAWDSVKQGFAAAE